VRGHKLRKFAWGGVEDVVPIAEAEMRGFFRRVPTTLVLASTDLPRAKALEEK